VLLFVVDAYVLNQGVLALVVAAAVILFVIPHALIARKYRGRRGPRLRNLMIVLLAVALVFAFIVVNNRMARERAEVLIAAVRNFRAAEQRYPLNLQELVPKYASEIPRAKYTFALNTFTYSATGAAPTLSYTSLPPYGRPTYSFDRGEWRFID
jgi:predicted PurR-regulated permease PerM